MKIIYKCEYCDCNTEEKRLIEEHERICDKNPANAKCWSCVRHFYLESGSFKMNICTYCGIDHNMDRGEKCKLYIKRNKDE